MQIRFRIRSTIGFMTLLSGVIFLLWSVGCSEDEQAQVDETAPLVRILSPTSVDFGNYKIEDSLRVTIYASDESGIESVDLMCTLHEDSTVILAGHISPVSGGNGTYETLFLTNTFPNGSKGVMWASATDVVGNTGNTETGIAVTMINGDLIGPPNPAITIKPYPEGRAQIDNFEFDAFLTTDDISTLNEVEVRWDFNGDGVWDVNPGFDDVESSAARKVYYTFADPGTIMVALEVKNTYYPQSATARKELIVLPVGGDPDPQGPYVEIPAGSYPIGVVDLNDRGSGYNGYFENELTYNPYVISFGDTTGTFGSDTLFVTISNSYRIDVHEVTNRMYTAFLRSATDSGLVAYDPYDEESVVRWGPSGQIMCELLGSSRLKYLNAVDLFRVDQEYEDHPVTGVTYAGARLYASYYGLRLPTEYEWEIAARGNAIATNEDPSVLYPWDPSDTISGAYANFSESGDPYETLDPTKATVPVGSYDGTFINAIFPTEIALGPLPGGNEGTRDQGGNVSEWVRDWYGRDTYLNMIVSEQTNDPQGPSTGSYRVIRGGNFGDKPGNLRVTRRSALSPFEMTPKVGFRTVHTVYGK